jgi:hypothetical protein
MISTHAKDFCVENAPNSPDFKIIWKNIIRFLQQVPAGRQNIKVRKMLPN